MSGNRLELDLTPRIRIFLNKKAKELGLTIENTVKELLIQEMNTKIDLGNGYYYDKLFRKVFNERNENIYLTNIQLSVFELLLENRGAIMCIDSIKRNIWKDKYKETSIFTLRNMISNIRKKTYYSIVTSHSSKGYSIKI